MMIISSLVKRVALWAIGAGVVFAMGGASADTLPATTDYVYSQTWIGPKVWFDICPCESWGDIAKMTASLAGGFMGAATSTLDFDYADGKCTIKETQANSVARYDIDGNLIVQFEKPASNGNGTYNVKCVVVKFKLENGRLWAMGTAAPYVGSTTTVPYDFGNNPGGTPLAESGNGYGINQLTVKMLKTATAVTVLGLPEDFGTVTPAYGRTFDHAVDEELGPMTAPASWTSQDGSKSAICTGWKCYTQAEYGGEWTLAGQGTENEVSSLAFAGQATRFVWQWQPNIACTATAGAGGSVSPTSASIAYGGTFTATATPESGYYFASWSGVEDTRRCENPITVTVTEPVNLVATFLPVGSQAEWTGGGSDALASNPANWKDGDCPIPGQGVLVTGDKPMTWDIAYPVGAWTQDANYSGTVTIGTVYAEAKVAGTQCLSILGDCTLLGGTWTHLAND